MNRLRFLLLALLCAAAVLPAQGQVSVALQIKRRSFIRYEPILATVTVTNLAGRELMLQDGESQWFGFQVNASEGNAVVPPINPNYHLDPLKLAPGESVKRTVNLSSLFSFSEFGHYRVKATIYSGELNKFFASPADAINVNEGRVIWQQTVGVPEGLPNAGNTHVLTLLSFQSDDKQYVYARVEDRDLSTVFCTHKLGHLITGQEPQVQMDSSNNLYVLQMMAPKQYMLTQIGINGELKVQTSYSAPKARPYLRRLASGQLQIVGGQRDVAQAGLPAEPTAKLSERPADLPK
jgi:hypothetical protein